MRLHLSLRSKLLLAVALILAPLLAGLVYAYEGETVQRKEVILDSQLRDAQTVSTMVDMQFDQAFSLAEVVANDPLVRSLDPTQIDPHLAHIARSYPQYLDIEVFDASGNSIGASVPYADGQPRLNVANERHFQRAISERAPQVSPVQASDRWAGRPIVVLAMPMPLHQGRVPGVAEVVLDLERLRLQLQAISPNPGQAIALVDPSGHMALYTVQPGLALKDVSGIAPIREALQGSSVKVIPFQVTPGDSRMGAWTPSARYGWVVGVSQSLDVALAPIHSAMRTALLAFAGVAILSILAALLLVQVLTNSLRRLVRHARALGRGEFENRVHITSGDEVQQLGDAFNQMAEHLMEREQDRDAVAHAARALVEPLALQAVAETVVQQSIGAIGARAAVLWLANGEKRELELMAQQGLSGDSVADVHRIAFDAALNSALAARTGQVQEMAACEALGPEFALARRLLQREGLSSVISMPLHSRGALVGVMTVAALRPFTTRQRSILMTLATLFAAAVENARLYEQVREALHLREEFLTAASHELRTPVTTLKGFAQLLQRHHELDPGVVRRALASIDTQADRIARLAGDLVEVSALRRGFLRLQCERHNLADLADQAIEQTRLLAGHNGHSFTLTRLSEPMVMGDRYHITEVFNDLLEAAIVRSTEGGLIAVTIDQRRGDGLVIVRDEGLAIQRERWPYVFEPFYQTFPAGMPGYRGVVGLGLFISREIVQRHGGHIWFESHEGQGSTFFFTLPLA